MVSFVILLVGAGSIGFSVHSVAAAFVFSRIMPQAEEAKDRQFWFKWFLAFLVGIALVLIAARLR